MSHFLSAFPLGVLKCPREWCLTGGLPKPIEAIPYSDIGLVALYLGDFIFTYVAQAVLAHLSRTLFTKYSSRKETALRMFKQAAEKQGFALGEVADQYIWPAAFRPE